MSEIEAPPRDIMLTSAKIVAEWFMNGANEPFVGKLADAIFAERNRCAAIVDESALEFERQAGQAADGQVHDAMLMASDALELTASAIREGGAA